MTVSTLRPSGTTSNTGALTGGATAHAVLADDTDASYDTLDNGERFVVTMGNLTLPAGAVIKQVAMRLRLARVSSSSYVTSVVLGIGKDSDTILDNAPVSITTITTFSWTEVGFTDAELDAASLDVVCDSANSARIYEAYLDATYVTIPVVAPSAPTGTISDTNLPTVEWPAPTLDSDGGVQTKYQTRFFTAAQYGIGGFDPATSPNTLDSGELSGADLSWEASVPLAAATYRAYVRVAQTVNGVVHWSDWAYTGFTVAASLPDAPTLTLTAEPSLGRILIESESAGGAATTDAHQLERSDDGGTTFSLIRTVDGDGIVLGEDIEAYDYEAENGVEVTYRARALHDYSGAYAHSDPTEDTVTWTSSDQWLKHPLSPSLNMVVVVDAYESRQRTARRGIFQPLGRTDTIVVADTRGPATGTVVFRVDTEDDQGDLDALLDSLSPLLLQMGATDQRPDRWVAFGDHDRQALIDKAWVEPTQDSLSWTEVARPS